MPSCSDRYTPIVVLVVFTAINFVTYFDRGVMAATITNVRSDKDIAGSKVLTDAESGMIVSAFMIGYMVTCPIFAALGSRLSSKHVMNIGLFVWGAACIATAFSKGYAMILVSRMFVGVGEAAYVGFAITIIDTIAPPAKRTLWIASFYGMIPVGTASGMAVGGVVASQNFGASFESWRMTFIGEIVFSIPIFVGMLLLPRRYDVVKKMPSNDGSASPSDDPLMPSEPADEEAYPDLLTAVRRLVCNVDYMLVVMGYGVYTFVLGGIAVWMVANLTEGPMQLSQSSASILIGSMTCVAGLGGSFFGGWMSDRLGGSRGWAGMYRCTISITIAVSLAIPTGTASLFVNNVGGSAVMFFLAGMALFYITAPVNALILSSVPLSLRTYAMSFSVLVIHLMGDFPSPAVVGAISDAFDGGCRAHNATDVCTEGTTGDCVWIPAKSEGAVAYCQNLFELRNALALMFAFLLFAAMLWGGEMWRLRSKVRAVKDMPPRSEEVRTESDLQNIQ